MPRHRRPNIRLIKIHRSYSVDEAALTLSVHKNTVRAWLKLGLLPIDGKRPVLINGLDLCSFLMAKREKGKQGCGIGHLYCVRCRAPKIPALGMVDYVPISPTAGNLRGICPNCDALIHRRVSLAQIPKIRGDLEIAFPEGEQRIKDSS
jgi:hypothetical protein